MPLINPLHGLLLFVNVRTGKIIRAYEKGGAGFKDDARTVENWLMGDTVGGFYDGAQYGGLYDGKMRGCTLAGSPDSLDNLDILHAASGVGGTARVMVVGSVESDVGSWNINPDDFVVSVTRGTGSDF